MRRLFKFIGGECVEITHGEPEYGTDARSRLTSDDMNPTLHPADGRYYTSRSKFREVTRAHGLVEVGDAYKNGYTPRDHDAERLSRKMKQERKRIISECLH